MGENNPTADIEKFSKTKELLICVDSDGCAIDSMEPKHLRCFGPLLVKRWSLEKCEDEVLALWNRINLYSLTRGVNRFRGLALALKEINERFQPICGVGNLLSWTERADELSNESLSREIAADPEVKIFKKALSWSEDVNRASELVEEIRPFEGVAEALARAHLVADIAVVSGAAPDALVSEWRGGGLIRHADILLSQSAGSKSFCLSELLKKGYERGKVLMCGDALGDLRAAEENGVFFFPVIVGRERESWEVFPEALDRLADGSYREYGESRKREFLEKLKGGKNNG